MQLEPGGQITHIDLDLMHLKLALSPGQRLSAMLDTHRFVVAVIRGRLRHQRPELSDLEIGMLIIEEIERAKRHEFRPLPLFSHPAET